MDSKEFGKRKKAAAEQWDTLRNLYNNNGGQPILVYGPPGTGKSAFPLFEARKTGRTVEVMNLNKFTSKPDALGHFINTPEGSVFCMNAAARAMAHGRTLVLNEVDHGGPEIVSTLHFICDDASVAQETLPDGKGTILTATHGYHVYATMNGKPENLPEAIRDRFQLKVNITTLSPEAVEKLPEYLNPISFCEGVTLRNLLAIKMLVECGWELPKAIKIIFGSVSGELSEALALAAA